MFDVMAFLVLLGACLFFGLFKNQQVQSEANYLFAKRRCTLFPLTCTLVMTEMNLSTLIAFSAFGYLAGIRALFLPFVFLIGLLFYAVSVAKKWKGLNASSVSALFTFRYGRPLATMASFFLLLSMSGFSATYVKSFSLLFSPFFPECSPWIISALFVILTLVMTLRGGLVAIIRTDILSFLFLIVLFPLFLFFSFKKGNFSLLNFERSRVYLPSHFLVSLIILTMFTYILAPWYGQKIFAAKSKKVAKQAVIFAAFLIFIFYGIGVLSAAFLKIENVSLTSDQEALFYILSSYIPVGLRGALFAVFFMMAATTLSGVWSAMSSMFIADFLKKSKKEDYKRGLLLTLFFAFISYLLGNLFIERILDKLILANIPTFALSFTLLAGFFWKRASSFGAILSMIVGILWGSGCYLYFGKTAYLWYWTVYGIILIFSTGIIGSYLKPNSLNPRCLSEGTVEN